MTNKQPPIHRDSVSYWREVTSSVNAKHPTPHDAVFERYLNMLNIQSGDYLLDVGVGFGRLVPACLNLRADVFGIDIDPEMIKAVRQSFPNDSERFCIGDSSNTDYPDEYFKHIVCWGVFDELSQGDTLLEMSRILKQGGTMLITGKNSSYEKDDAEALAAEKGARAKNHPNYFTNINDLDLAGFGLEIYFERYFSRRGDFANDTGAENRPDRFYEYLFVLKKAAPPVYTNKTIPAIASSFSTTFNELEKG